MTGKDDREAAGRKRETRPEAVLVCGGVGTKKSRTQVRLLKMIKFHEYYDNLLSLKGLPLTHYFEFLG